MARKRLSLFQYQHILEEMRSGVSNREIAAKGLASRNKLRAIKEVALDKGWLNTTRPMPAPEELRASFPAPPIPIRASSLESYREQVEGWADAGHTPKQIFRALKRDH